MRLTITGIGVWGPGLQSWRDVCRLMDGSDAAPPDGFVAPRPEAIPARERRRAGLTINLAVEVVHQACAMAGMAADVPASVFASAMGDTDVTDYMCRKLATADRLLSPTRFHNSVHNAPSGYWSISAANRQPSSFVGGFRDSFACGLLEAAACGCAGDTPVALAAYDVANAAPFGDVLAVRQTLGLALLLVPGEGPAGWPVEVTVVPGVGAAPRPEHPRLARLADANPMGTALTLLEMLAGDRPARLRWPVGAGSSLELAVKPWTTPC